jgi:signal transduction histidine kinase
VRRRLLIVLVGTVTLALMIAAVSAASLLRRQDRASEIRRLREGSQKLADLNAPGSLDIAQSTLNLATSAQVRFPQSNPTLNQIQFVQDYGLPLQQFVEVRNDWKAADFAAVARGETVARVASGWVWAMAPIGLASTTDVLTSQVGDTGTAGPDDEIVVEAAAQFDAIVLVVALPDRARSVVGLIAIGSLGALLLTVIAAFVIAQNLSAPLRRATRAYQQIARGDLSVRVADVADVAVGTKGHRRNDEVAQLLGALDVMAESLQRARDQERQFLLAVSHDLRTPLTSIRGYAEALADGAVDDPTRSAKVIVSESRRLERLVQDLLELGKLESNQFSLKPVAVNLTDLVIDLADGFIPTATRSNLVLMLAADPDTAIRTQLDPDRFAQLLANLVENALKFAKTTVTIELSGHTPDSGSVAVVSVTDDGPGIDNDDLPRVFDRTFTSDRKPTRQIGSGLGLAIVHEIVTAMGASIDISTGQTGTTFRVTLPQAAMSQQG